MPGPFQTHLQVQLEFFRLHHALFHTGKFNRALRVQVRIFLESLRESIFHDDVINAESTISVGMPQITLVFDFDGAFQEKTKLTQVLGS